MLRKNPQKTIATLTLESPELLARVRKASEGWVFKNRTVVCTVIEPQTQRIRPQREEEKEGEEERRRKRQEPAHIRIANATVPLWQITYETQLANKKREMQKVLYKVQRELEKANAMIEVNKKLVEKEKRDKEVFAAMMEQTNGEKDVTDTIDEVEVKDKDQTEQEQTEIHEAIQTDVAPMEEMEIDTPIKDSITATISRDDTKASAAPSEELNSTTQAAIPNPDASITLKRPWQHDNNNRSQSRKKLDKPRIFVPKISTVVPSSKIEGYRTKMEFAIGMSAAGEATCGFVSASYGNSPAIEFPGLECRQVSDIARGVAQTVQEAVRASQFAVYDRESQTGVWRLAVFRSSQNEKETMLIIQATSAVDKNEFESFVRSQNFEMDVVAIQYYDNCADGFFSDSPLIYLTERKSIEEKMCDLTFQISPFSFFQINPSTAEVLYKSVAELASAGNPDCVLDLCCGTGTIALTMAKNGLSNIVGVELVEEAVVDAKQNAIINGVDVSFHAGRVEDVVPRLDLRGKNCVAVLDPPRSGVGSSLSRVIREKEFIRKVIYVSCNPKAAVRSLLPLYSPKLNHLYS